MGIQADSTPLSRFCRSVLQPFARAAFVLHKGASLDRTVNISPRAGDETSSPRRAAS